MGTNELRGRSIWQDINGGKASVAEVTFFDVLEKEFEGTDFRIRSHPREFKNIYSSVKLSEETLNAIYNPDETWVHGVIPDFAIDNIKTDKTLYVEVKRQDGWVENKPRSAGRGNAHERSNKYFTPGLLKLLRKQGKLGDDVLPFWVVFQGDIARDPKRVREINLWYDSYKDNFFMWHNTSDHNSLIDHFNKNLKKYLL
jgi:hypothetical protein